MLGSDPARFCDGKARTWQVLATCVEWSGKGCFIPARRVATTRPPSDSPERRAPSRMRIDWYMLQPPFRLAQPLVKPHQSAAVMVNAQADAQLECKVCPLCRHEGGKYAARLGPTISSQAACRHTDWQLRIESTTAQAGDQRRPPSTFKSAPCATDRIGRKAHCSVQTGR